MLVRTAWKPETLVRRSGTAQNSLHAPAVLSGGLAGSADVASHVVQRRRPTAGTWDDRASATSSLATLIGAAASTAPRTRCRTALGNKPKALHCIRCCCRFGTLAATTPMDQTMWKNGRHQHGRFQCKELPRWLIRPKGWHCCVVNLRPINMYSVEGTAGLRQILGWRYT